MRAAALRPATGVGERAARAAVLGLGRRLGHGSIVVDDGSATTVLGAGEPVVRVRVHDPRAWAAVGRGSIGLGDSYARGWWDCDDLTTLFRILVRDLARPMAVADRLGAATRPLLDPLARLRRPDPSADRRNVRAHYDLSNELFALMLDPSMTYSCALFDEPGCSLEAAQAAKLEQICASLDLEPGDHVVEIGTGWGSFAVHAATRHGCRVTTTTVSAAQHREATRRVAAAGVADRVAVLDADYRDLAGTYDKLVAIEMIEAVDWRDHDRFFATCARLLRPGGLAALQAIVIADGSFERAKRHDDFVRRFIFPGGCLPSITSLTASAARAGLRMIALRDIGGHYPETLRRWRRNLAERSAAVAALGLGEELLRRWDVYLTYCEAAFAERHVSDVQVVLATPGWRHRPTVTAR